VVARARLDIAAGNLDLVRRRFEDALKLVPDNLQTLVIYAYFQEVARRRSEAKALLTRAIEAHPKALEPRVLLIDLLKKENERAAAMAVAEKALALHPDDPIAIEQAADIHLWHGDQRRGLETLEKLIRVLPGSPESYFKLAKAQFKAGLKAEAEANLGRALALPMDQSRTQRLYVFGLVDDSKTLEAIELARKSHKVARVLQADKELWSSGMGANTRYDALSGAGAR
jgi:tetratricopeptide (TPR) repeat protein